MIEEAQSSPAKCPISKDAETAQLHEDLEYVTNYPRAKKYVSLFPKGVLDEYGRGEVAKMRAEIKEIMRQRGGESERSAAARAEAAGLAAAAAAEIDAKDEAEAVSLMAPRPPPICN